MKNKSLKMINNFKFMKNCIKEYGTYPYPKFMIIDNKKLVYLEMPKVANCSIKGSMMNRSFNDDYSVQRESLKYIKHRLNKRQKKYFKFTYVRDPFERLVSCYESKYHKDKGKLGTVLSELEYDNYLFGYLRRDYGFSTFVIKIFFIPNALKDHHFKPQSCIVFDKNGNCKVDYVGRFEHIEKSYCKIQKTYNLDKLPCYNKSGKKNYMDYYNRFTVWLAYIIFRKDIDNFQYKKNFLELLKHVYKKDKK